MVKLSMSLYFPRNTFLTAVVMCILIDDKKLKLMSALGIGPVKESAVSPEFQMEVTALERNTPYTHSKLDYYWLTVMDTVLSGYETVVMYFNEH